MDHLNIESFICPICLELAIDTFECNVCGQLFCLKCQDEIKKSTKKCPICRSTDSFQKNLFCQNLILNLKLECKYNCGILIPICQTDEHSYVCNARLFNCYIEKCNFKGLQKELFKHMCDAHSEKLTFLAENFIKMEKDFIFASTKR
jgi:hypothetical protein